MGVKMCFINEIIQIDKTDPEKKAEHFVSGAHTAIQIKLAMCLSYF